jgi:Lon protease-like protein
MAELLLPLFPLQVVLFPRTGVPLHIFEERYKEMIGEAIEARSEFGIVLVLEQGLANTGCAAVVEQVFRKFDDGRMDILARGQRRFDLVRLNQERSFLRGEVQFFDDDADDASPSELQRFQALQLFQQLSEHLPPERGEKAEPPQRDDPQLSFQIASRLPVEIAFRQGLLQLRSEGERLRLLVPYLEKMASRAVRAADAKARAGSNGRAH